MKRNTLIVGLFSVLSLVSASSSALAARKASAPVQTMEVSESPLRMTQSASDRGGSKGGMSFGLGFVNSGVFSNDVGAISFLIDLTSHDTLTVLLGFPSAGTTGTAINMTGGAAYRRTLLGNHDLGFHLGGSASAGNDSTGAMFQTNIAILAGFRYEIANHILVMGEFGPRVAIYGSSPVAVKFGIVPATGFGGLSFHYIF